MVRWVAEYIVIGYYCLQFLNFYSKVREDSKKINVKKKGKFQMREREMGGDDFSKIKKKSTI